MERKSLEQQLFTWDQWNEGADANDAIFYDVTLAVAIGDFPVGTKFKNAYFATSGSFVVFLDEQNNEHVFELNVSVGRQLTEADFPSHEEGCDCGHDH